MHDYTEQLKRARRYYVRFKRLNDGMEHRDATEAYMDDIVAFFQNCYHIKDWLKNDPGFTKHSSSEIEDYVSKTLSLAICADICNGSKHLDLNRGARSGDVPKIGQKVISLDVTTVISGKEIPTRIGIQLEIEHAGNKLDAFQLATDALQAWESFIT